MWAIGVVDIILPSRVGEEESNKILAGENILVIKTPKGLYVRTKTGRIYAVNSGNQFNSSPSAAWGNDQLTMPSFPQSSPSVYATDSPRSLLDPWTSSNSPVDIYNSMPYNNIPRVTSMLNGDLYSSRYLPQFSSAHCGLASSIPSSDTSSDIGNNFDPTSFLNIMTSDNGNVAWNSPVACQSMGSIVSDEVRSNVEAPLSWMRQQFSQDSSEFPVNNTVEQSPSCTDLPSDLLCIDASCATDRTDVSDSILPALTVRDGQHDSDSWNSLTFDDDDSFAYNCSSSVDPGFNNCQSSLYSTHSDPSLTATPLFSSTATTTGGLYVGDIISDSASDFSELSTMMNDGY